ncbi:MAG: HNH endonuclease [Acidimicrobiales bacterium]
MLGLDGDRRDVVDGGVDVGVDVDVGGDAGIRSVLRGLPAGLAKFDVSGFDEPELKSLLGDVRAVQRCLDGLVIRIGVRSNRLAGEGVAAPAEETLRGEGEVGSRQARRESARARTVEQVEGLSNAASVGATTGSHVDSVARHTAKLSDEQREFFNFADLVERAQRMLPESFDRYVKRCVDAATTDHGLRDTKAKQAASEFRYWFDHATGMGRFSGLLDPERYEMLVSAIDRRVSSIAAACDEAVTKDSNLAAQALVELVTEPGSERGDIGGADRGRRMASVLVVVDHDTMVNGAHERSVRQTESGHDVAPESIARLCCDAVVRPVSLDQSGVPINVGRKYRTATDAQWAAVKTIHARCGWEGCAAPIGWCQAHHIREWENGGATDFDNLIPLCSKHHHRVHEGQWSIKLLPDRSLKIYKPNGTHHATVPTPQRC